MLAPRNRDGMKSNDVIEGSNCMVERKRVTAHMSRIVAGEGASTNMDCGSAREIKFTGTAIWEPISTINTSDSRHSFSKSSNGALGILFIRGTGYASTESSETIMPWNHLKLTARIGFRIF